MRRFAKVNYYAVLGVSPLASRGEIRAAYRVLARTEHPDVGGDPERFSLVAEAWEVLGNDEERAYYNADRKLRMRADRPYTQVRYASSPSGASERVATAEHTDAANGLTDTQRWMRNKRRL